MKFEPEQYLPFLEGIDMPLRKKEAMLRATWHFMQSQVDQAFGLHPVQCARKAGKKSLSKTFSGDLESIETTVVSSFNSVSSANDETYKRKA